jgi:hypothetical protein
LPSFPYAEFRIRKQIQHLARYSEGPPPQPFTLVIEIDAWNIRERDDWGQTEALRAQGKKPERWHWVYLATVFRLDHRGHTAGDRALISERGFVATRGSLEALTAQRARHRSGALTASALGLSPKHNRKS